MKRARLPEEEAAAEENAHGVCEVNRHNLDVVCKLILTAAASCDFVAFDTEFSGLDHGPDFKSNLLDVRYEAFRAMVDKYALLQFGLSFMRRKADQSGWSSISFTFHVVCMNNYTVAPVSMIFLAENGLSLTDVYKRGIQFTPPAEGVPPVRLQQLLHAVAEFRKPLVVHNGLVDLLFLWRSFFAPLPATAAEWIAHMSKVFPIVYDTKHISSNVMQEESSYLQYLFKALYLRRAAAVECVSVPLQYQIITDSFSDTGPSEICGQFARHGNCRYGVKCTFSHDVDFIVHVQHMKELGLKPTATSRPNNASQRNLQRPQLQHSAGFDAFATAYVFASYWEKLCEAKIKQTANHVYLMYSDRPLLFMKSEY
jgi:target of EGR1 protein 1